MPVRLPAKVARPPGADSWPAVSAVMVSAVVAPKADAGHDQGRPGVTGPGGGGAGSGRRAACRPGTRADLAGEACRAFTRQECGADGDEVMKPAPLTGPTS